MPVRRPRLWDPELVEKEYVTSNLSIRELARRHKVTQSSMAKWARDHDWQGKRISYQSAISRRGYEVMAAEIAQNEGVIRQESIVVMRATLKKYAEALTRGDINVTAKDAVEAIKTLAILLGEPQGGSRDPAVDARNVTKPDADHLRRVVEAARRRVAESSVLEGPDESGPEGARIH